VWQAGLVPDAADALRTAAGVGPFFAVDLQGEGASWRDFTELVEDAPVLRQRVGAVRAALAERTGLDIAAVEERVAASLDSLALAARLIAPTFAAAVLTGTVPVLDLTAVRWQNVVGGPVPIAFVGAGAVTASASDELAGLLDDNVIRLLAAPLVGAYGEYFRLSAKVLWGNVASAMAGAAAMLAAPGAEHAERAMRVAQALLGVGLLRGHGRYLRPWPERPERFFVRNSCCLYYRIPGGDTCGDCVLVSADARLATWRAQAHVIDERE
jgi:hypothetical protein